MARAMSILALHGWFASLSVPITALALNKCSSDAACRLPGAENTVALGLLQRSALSITDPMHSATVFDALARAEPTPPPERRGYMAHYNDSSCLIPEGSEANISTESDECLLGWNFTCSCNTEGEKVIEAHRYLGGCKNTSIEHVRYFPVGRCLPASMADSNTGMYVKVDDLGTCPCCGTSQCKIWGDPHITVFDQSRPQAIALLGVDGTDQDDDSHGAYGSGDYWVIKSELISIQARYRRVYYPKAKIHDNSFLTGVAIGGPFLKGKTLLVGPRDTGKVELVDEVGDVEEILKYGGMYNDHELIEAHYREHARMVKNQSETSPGIYIHLPRGVKVEVNRFSQHMDLSITMAADAAGQGGVDGQCGNFNGDPSDDTAEMIGARVGYEVPKDQLLFRHSKQSEEHSEAEAESPVPDPVPAHPTSDMASMARMGDPSSAAVHPLKVYLYTDPECEVPANGSYISLEAGKELCELGWNFTCSCDVNKKVVVAQQHWPECGPASYGPLGAILRSVVVPNVCHAPIDIDFSDTGLSIPFEVSSTYWRLDASSCPCCEEPSECTLHGDPHITVFDHAESHVLALLDSDANATAINDDEEESDSADFFGWGDFWLVKSEQVSIQARYRKVYYPKAREPLNHTYLTSVAVSGPFMKGHKLIIEPKLGDITWSHAKTNHHETILKSGEEDSLFEIGDIIKARYYNRTAIVPELKPVVAALDLELPSQVKVFVDRFKKHLDLRISMVPSAGGKGGIDGQCGNFNGNPVDDTAELINERIGYQVPASELLFEKNSNSMQA